MFSHGAIVRPTVARLRDFETLMREESTRTALFFWRVQNLSLGYVAHVPSRVVADAAGVEFAPN
jgi:hypothetical protein